MLSAKCMDGPTSLPTGMPLPRARVRPMTLAIKAFRVKYSFSTTPLRMVFSSGIPEPEVPGKEKGLIKIEFAANSMILLKGPDMTLKEAITICPISVCYLLCAVFLI